MLNFISIAHAAEAAEQTSQASLLANFAPLVLIMVVFYFLSIRPQQKKFKDHQNMISKIAKGDKVLLSGGILGTVAKAEENNNYLTVEIAENVKIKVRKDTISEIINEQLQGKTA